MQNKWRNKKLLEIIFSRYHKTLWSTALPLNMCEWKRKKNTWLTAHFAIKRKNSSGIPGMISSAVFARCKNFWVYTQMKSLFIINVMGFVKKSKYYCGILLKKEKKSQSCFGFRLCGPSLISAMLVCVGVGKQILTDQKNMYLYN